MQLFSHSNKSFVTISNAKLICSRVFLFLSVHAQTLKNERKKSSKIFTSIFRYTYTFIYIRTTERTSERRIHLYIHLKYVSIYRGHTFAYTCVYQQNGMAREKNLKMAAHEYMCYTDLEVFSIRFPYTCMCMDVGIYMYLYMYIIFFLQFNSRTEQ